MIIYFSATGNSEYAAKEIANELNEKAISANDIIRNNFSNLPELTDKRIILVFPIHSWGAPKVFLNLIQKLNFKEVTEVHAVCTCGDDTGLADDTVKKALSKHRLKLQTFHSVIMPNTYILLPGFNTDSKEIETEKIRKASIAIKQICDCIKKQTQDNKYLHRGILAWAKTKLIYPAFTKNANGKTKFTCNDKSCTNCGTCIKSCPTANISIKENKITWGDNCTQCLACIHRCPQKAIDHGNITRNKGRYFFKK